jgi:riboflavin kinase/FMN adenylyltransferase
MIHVDSLDDIFLDASWLTIGVFDGVHRGHQQVIRELTAGARKAGVPAAVVTFWPHPAAVLGTGHVRCLTTPDERAELLSALGVDAVITETFDDNLAATSADVFVARLKDRLGFRHLLIGYDFALGKGREGNATRLDEIGRKLGYTVKVVPALGDESGVISSTEIRKLVATGEVAEAASLLGHAYSIRGPVVHGDGRGRDLGFPTANIDYPNEKMLPANGVYACRASVGDRSYLAAVNVGNRPQFHSEVAAPHVEAYLLDCDENLYDRELRLDFVARLRDELKFPSVPDLIQQMRRDVLRTRELLSHS